MLNSLRSALGRRCWPPFHAGRAEGISQGITFLRGAVSWTAPFSPGWGSSQGQRAASNIQCLQSHKPSLSAVHQDITCQGLWLVWDRHYPMNIHFRVLGQWAGGRSWGVRVSKKPSWPIRMHGLPRGKAWVLWDPVLSYALQALGSLNFAVGIF